jgi:hypothetical protein
MSEFLNRNFKGLGTAFVFALLIALALCGSAKSNEVEDKTIISNVTEKIEKGGAIAGAVVEGAGVVASEVEEQTGKTLLDDEKRIKAENICDTVEAVAGAIHSGTEPLKDENETANLFYVISGAALAIVLALRKGFLNKKKNTDIHTN